MNFGGNVLNGSNQANESPEVISKAVACLPANQMFELMLQMKGCIQNNPLEARTMLAKNPQLTYALLHAQILLDIMDPKDFLAIMSNPVPAPAPAPAPAPVPVPVPAVASAIKTEPGLVPPQATLSNAIPQPVPAPVPVPIPGLTLARPILGPPQPVPAPTMVQPPSTIIPTMVQPPPTMVQAPKIIPQPKAPPKQVVPANPSPSPSLPIPKPSVPIIREKPTMVPAPQTNIYSDTDFRAADPRILRNNPVVSAGDQDLRSMLSRPKPTEIITVTTVTTTTTSTTSTGPSDPRSRPPEVARNDPRLARGIVPSRPPPATLPAARPVPTNNPAPSAAPTSDQDKTALIMQVLQLSDEQIALLPPDQRASILHLKEQIARSTQR